METKNIDGVECEVLAEAGSLRYGDVCDVLYYRPIPKPKKTLVEMYNEPGSFNLRKILDAIEKRLEALEGK